MTKPHSDTHAHTPVSDIAAHLAGQAESLCRHLLPEGRREGSEWRCGSVQGEPGKSLGVHLTGAKAGIWADFATGEGGDLLDLIAAVLNLDTASAIGWAKRWLGIDDGARAPAPRPTPGPRSAPKQEEPDEDAAKRTEAALAIWRSARPPDGTRTATYLRHRAITCAIPASIRDHAGLRHARTGLNLPCMVAAITGADRKVTAVQRSFLRVDGLGRANVSGSKLSLGRMHDGAVHLGPAGPVLGVAEGVETGLSAAQLFDVPVWCALGASRMGRLWLPPEVRELHIFGDNGAPGHEAAERAAAVYQAQGRRVVIRYPDERFGDWNDVLREESPA